MTQINIVVGHVFLYEKKLIWDLEKERPYYNNKKKI
jgi:hypothetical protein